MNEKLKIEILDNLKEDFIGFWMIYAIIKDYYIDSSKEKLTSVVVDEINYLCNTSSVRIGEMQEKADGKVYFVPWNLPTEEKFEKIISAWRVKNFKEPNIGDIEIYFTTTDW